MAFNELTGRSDVQGGANPPGGLIPEDSANEIIKEATEASAVMRLARRLPNMSRAQRRLPVLSALPTAYFVNGEAGDNDGEGFKQTTHMEWTDVFINAEEIAVIAPVPENVVADAAFDLWGEMRPAIAEAIGLAFDRAVLYGENAPGSWPTDLTTQIGNAGHVVTVGTGNDLYDDLLAEGGVIATVEEDGYMVNGHLAKLSMRGKLRGLRDTTSGQPLFTTDLRERQNYALDGEPIVFPRNGAFVASDDYELISGDFSKLVYAVRQDITWKLLDQAVITDPANGNAIVYNLAQQDMVALRVVFRAGWALPNPVNRVNPTAGTRLPFAALSDGS